MQAHAFPAYLLSSKIHAPLFPPSLTNLVSHTALAANTTLAATTGSPVLFRPVNLANSPTYISVLPARLQNVQAPLLACFSLHSRAMLLALFPTTLSMHHHAVVAAVLSHTSTANLIVPSAPAAVRIPVIFL
jgi:hypothetical protein